jgi:hypothetical protein
MNDTAVARHHVVVDSTQGRAFATFTQRLGDFETPEHNLLGSPVAETVLEPPVGGHIVDRGLDGSECRRVLAFEAPDRWVAALPGPLHRPAHRSALVITVPVEMDRPARRARTTRTRPR